MNLKIDFKFSNKQDAEQFQAWVADHPNADEEQIFAHAKAHGTTGAFLGDGTEWTFDVSS